ncbi:hypothetical protein TRVL_06991 [Trypanosoma vivax]|nr:hypothetical protein TRVL_06991 [Trypanosoma vivax]
MLRCCWLLRTGLNIPTGDELDGQILVNRFRMNRRERGWKWFPRAISASRLHGWAAVAGILIGAAVFIGPWFVDEYREFLGYKFVPEPPTSMPRTSVVWWENEWRKGNPLWRAGESDADFYRGPFEFVLEVTGRKMHDAAAFKLPHQSGGKAPRALVPLCGDSPIIAELARRGFEVDAVDASETAMRTCTLRTERLLHRDAYSRVHLHWRDFFAPELWQDSLAGVKFDLIYERQGMTSLNRDQRDDYVALLKRALADDGVIYVEGIFRTGRVSGNKVQGPPFSLSRRELRQLFPQEEGYLVQCEERNDAMTKLSREDRVLQRVPRELYVTPFHCAVFKEQSVNRSKTARA